MRRISKDVLSGQDIYTPYEVHLSLLVAILLGVSKVVDMITSRQIPAARALLGWSQQLLADKAIVSLNAVARLENGAVDSRISTVQAVQKALVKAGIEFLDADQKGEGVRLKSPKSERIPRTK